MISDTGTVVSGMNCVTQGGGSGSRGKEKKEEKMNKRKSILVTLFFLQNRRTFFNLNDTKLSYERSSVAWQLKEKVKSPEREKVLSAGQ